MSDRPTLDALASFAARIKAAQSHIDLVTKDFERAFPGVALRLTGRRIALIVAKAYGVPPEDITNPQRRTVKIVLARQHAVFLIRNLTKLSWPQMTSIFAGCDHSTVILNYKRHQRRINRGEEIIDVHVD